MTPALRVENVSKRYRLGLTHARSLNELASRLTRRMRGLPPVEHLVDLPDGRPAAAGEFWALRDLSFDVEPGQVVGIVGRNGAGKSTLLKILSRITRPSTGRIELAGRVGSLLEVGTGFHPEMTGRENVYMNGTLLGMSKREVARRLDEIVDFSGVEQFLDTPVKRYSSGMKIRLGFAVAAHLDVEILAVDEILAVGDASFQRKCFQKMQSVCSDGRTILFVSHNMAAVRAICTHGILLDRGRLTNQGRIEDVADEYLAAVGGSEEGFRSETRSYSVDRASLRSLGGAVIKPFHPVEVRVRVTAKSRIGSPGLYVGFLNTDMQRIAGLDLRDFASPDPLERGDTVELGFLIESLPLLPGTYQCEFHLKDLATHRIEQLSSLLAFEVVDAPVYGGRRLDQWFGHVGLKARPLCERIEQAQCPASVGPAAES